MKRVVLISAFLLWSAWGLRAQSLVSQQGDNGLYGFVDASGAFVIEPQYDDVHFDFYEGVACVVKGKKYRFIDTSGKEISKAYDHADYYDANNLCMVNNGGKEDEYGLFSGGKYGCIDLSGKEVIAVKYASIGTFNDYGVAIVNEGGSVNKNGDFAGGKNGFVSVSGEVLVAPKYAFIGEFDERGIAWANVGGSADDAGECTGGKFGYVSSQGSELLAPSYDFIGELDENGICWVNKGGKIFTSDKNVEAKMKSNAAREKDPKKLAQMREDLENAITGGKVDVLGRKVSGGKYGFANKAGREIVAVKYAQTANAFVENRAWVLEKKYGYVDTEGRAVSKFLYDKAGDFSNGRAVVWKAVDKNTSLCGFIDEQGNEITEMKYAEARPFISGFAAVKTPSIYDKKTKSRSVSKFGFVDMSGREITDLKYDGVGTVVDGIAVCRIGSNLGYVNSQGTELTPFSLLEATQFDNGVAWVMVSDADAAVNKRGEELSTTGVRGRKDAGKYGLINTEGKALTDFVYTKVNNVPSSEGLIVARNSDSNWGFLDMNGEVAIPFTYTAATRFVDGLAPASTSDGWGFIDKSGKAVIEHKYKNVSLQFKEDVAGVMTDTGWGGVNRQGELVIPALLSSSDDYNAIVETVYVPGGCKPLTERQVQVFNIRKKNLEQHFNIKSIIDNEYWDY